LFIKIFQQFTTSAEYENSLNNKQRLAIDVNIEKFKQVAVAQAIEKMIEAMRTQQAVQMAVPPPQPPVPSALQGKYPGQGAPGSNAQMPPTTTERQQSEANLHLAQGQPSEINNEGQA
jgi:hypothetical protein